MKNHFFILFFLLLGGFSSLIAQSVADFEAFPLTQCNPPYEVTFENFSQGDTAWHWDFGDGNTSFFPNPIHLYTTTGTFTVTLITFGPTGSDTLTKVNYVTTLAPPANPTVNLMTDTVNCGSSSRFVATGAAELVWYNAQDQIVSRGDTLDLPIVTQDASYFVQSEDESAPMFVGAKDPDSVGTGSIFNGDQALIFNVLGDIRLKSVLVEALGAGLREFVLEDTFGVILQTIPVFVPDGKSRLYLDLELLPGNYRLRGNEVNLFRNNNGGTQYPYEIPGLIEIVGSTAGNNFYYYFYDWEITTFCRSDKVGVEVVTNGIPTASASLDTVIVSCGDGAELIATAPSSVYWFDALDNEVGRGDTLRLGFAGTSAPYFAKNVEASGLFSIGPKDPDSLGTGMFVNSNNDSWLFFRASTAITLHSVWVNADVAGTRTFEIIDENGEVAASYTFNLPAGKSRVSLNTELGAGSYQIGGNNLGLFQNDNATTNYPYSLPGVVSITGSSDGRDHYSFFYDWEISTVCFSEGEEVFLEVDPGPSPVLNQDSLTINCVDDAVFVGTGSNVIWYDENDLIISEGDSLKLEQVAVSASYYARNVEKGTSQKFGPVDGDSVGNGGYFGFFFPNGLAFEVYGNIVLESVWVDARSAGNRDLFLNDGNGDLLQTITVNIPSGKSRVRLNLELEPGLYELIGSNLDLFRNTDGFSYPYELPGLASITGPVGFGGPGGGEAYYFFYDWEVSTICKSDPVEATVTVAPLATPTINATDTLCYEDRAVFTASSPSASWYGPNGEYLGEGKSIQTAPLTSGGRYTAIAEDGPMPQNVGPLNGNAVGAGTYDEPFFPSYLTFTVNVPIRVNSFLVDAGSGATRDLLLVDGAGNLIQTYTIFIPSGRSRLELGWELQPGTYALGGENLNLYRNTNGGLFPYEIPGVFSITGATGARPGSPIYNYFYDWEVQELPCESDPVTFDIYVNPQLTASFSFVQSGAILNFNNTSPQGNSFLWDFGDGNTSTSQNASHTYAASGTYIVTLTISDGICEVVERQTITVPSGVAIDPLLAQSFQLYPNPGEGLFTVEAKAQQVTDMQVQIFDLTGRLVYTSSMEKTRHFEQTINLETLTAGTYIIKLQAGANLLIRKYLLMK